MIDFAHSRRGRPRGSKNGSGKGLAPIVDWTPLCEMIVQASVLGRTNIEIAESTGYTKERISQILNDERAKVIKLEAVARIKAKMEGALDTGLTALAFAGMNRLKETIDEDFVPGSEGKKHQDHVSLTLVKGFLPQSDENRARKVENIPEKLLDRLTSAMEKSNSVDELHGKLTAKEGKFIVECDPTKGG